MPFAVLQGGSIAPCNPNPPGTVVTYNLGSDPTVGSNALVPNGASSGGCQQVNGQFTVFQYNTLRGATAGSNVNAQFSGTNEAVIDVNVASAQWTASSGAQPASLFGFQLQLDPSDVPGPNLVWMITGITLSVSGASLGGGTSDQDNVLVGVPFCVNVVNCGGNGNFAEISFELNGTSAIAIDFACYNNGDTSVNRPCAKNSPTGSGSSVSLSLGAGAQLLDFLG